MIHNKVYIPLSTPLFVVFFIPFFYSTIVNIANIFSTSDLILDQVLKSLIFSGVVTVLLSLLYVYLLQAGSKAIGEIFKILIMSLLVAALYSILAFILYFFYKIDLGMLLFSISSDYSWAIGDGRIVRVPGLPGGINASAIIFSSLTPFLLSRYYAKKSILDLYLYLVLAFAVFTTISKTGILMLLMSFILVTFLHRKYIGFFWFSSIIAFLFFLVPNELIQDIVEYRLNFDEGRWQNMMQSISLINENPFFGSGLNTYSVVSGNSFMFEDPHNSWVLILVEQGLIGFFYQVFIYLYLIGLGIRSKNYYGIALISLVVPLAISGMFNDSLNMIFVNFVLTLLLITTINYNLPYRE